MRRPHGANLPDVDAVVSQILDDLAVVDQLRAQRAADPVLAEKVLALKAYQARRFEKTYRDLLSDRRYCAASRFFLDELYGPKDFDRRDAEFARVVPAMVRVLPSDAVSALRNLARLHALSEGLDNRMAALLVSPSVSASTYVRTWRLCGRPEERREQIYLTLQIGHALDRFTRHAWLGRLLRMMRAAAHKAGLGEIQQFLERGFETFGRMKGADAFLATVEQRERSLAAAMNHDKALPAQEAAPPLSDLTALLP